jgi:protein-tyrosine phosphatase
MAELLFRAWASPDADVRVSSAGTHALIGHPIDFSSASALGQLGVDPSRHRARQYEPWMVDEADLVLTAERTHRDLVMTGLPRAFRRTFTMKEFARLAPRTSAGRPAEVIAEVARIRGIDGLLPADSDDMPDPYRDPIAKARTIAQQITDSVRATVDALGVGVDPRRAPAPVGAHPSRRRPMPKRADL